MSGDGLLQDTGDGSPLDQSVSLPLPEALSTVLGEVGQCVSDLVAIQRSLGRVEREEKAGGDSGERSRVEKKVLGVSNRLEASARVLRRAIGEEES